ncbi:outer membrane protein assembly factor BamB family protein [Lignipirellula cremea]|uniref:Outer membrane biogenesis protein BamB n=1 Tax=Lignipirellula cremea TaxID=2528010 RepID=A0A518DWD4_9BACT|nr:PQQ-binding-like beta-propeller repeat protein [Lignipirellula cremea]QDU96146.1 outer membrane biogenesis protein BamB [Lignipirellula cremea]
MSRPLPTLPARHDGVLILRRHEQRPGSHAGRCPAFRLLLAAFAVACCCVQLPAGFVAGQEPAAAKDDKDPAAGPLQADPFKDVYRDYVPDFVAKITGAGWGRAYYQWERDEETMRLSSEPHYFSLNILNVDTRANALVEAALKKESEGQYREALKIYQQVIEKYPRSMFRVSDYGVFVPVGQYCQRRILGFPASDLQHYRQLYDARAKEAYDQARRQYSLLGLSDIAEGMLATSYGGKAILELGNAALDAGHYLAALEHLQTVRDQFPDRELHTPELELKIAYCRRMLGEPAAAVLPAATEGESVLSSQQFEQFQKVVAAAKSTPPEFSTQPTSPGSVSANDYTLLPPTADPLGIAKPVWKARLPGARDEFHVFTHPTVTRDSVLYRHKNLVYCRSLLNGDLRWQNDLGGRSNWQNWGERQFPQEDLLVQDGLVFTAINKAGPSLVALDEVTGQLRWAYGPMAAASEEQARMRFETAPTGGPRTVFAGYVLDNIEGETHTDTEYGVIAFDSKTGRVNWRAALCRLAPGKFAGGYSETHRNRIRSFVSPPLYHQGTVYYNTNSGAIAALDALSGRIKWLTRYPYYPEVHDATRVFGRGGDMVQHSRVYFTPHQPMFWYNQRPLMVGERLFLTPVDTNSLYCIDRRTGKLLWSQEKQASTSAYLLGMTRDNLLAVALSGRNKKIGAQETRGPVQLLSAATGETVWESPDVILADDQPVMKHYVFASPSLHYNVNNAWFEMTARPHMTSDGKVFLPMLRYEGYPIFGYMTNLGVVDLNERKVVDHRRYYSGEILARADVDIRENGPTELKAFEENPAKDEKSLERMAMLREVIADTVPANAHGPFLPFERITLERYGQPFELRISAREIELVYDRPAVISALAKRTDPLATFARAELAIADARLADAAELLTNCLAEISSEDVDFRAAINQQLYRVHQMLARGAIRSGNLADELLHCLGMSRTAGTLAEEIETLFAVADAYQRQGKSALAGQALQTIISTYGQHEYPLASFAARDPAAPSQAAAAVLERYRKLTGGTLLQQELGRSLELLQKGMPLYYSALSPLPKTLTVRAGEFAAEQLQALAARDADYASQLSRLAETELQGRPADEQLARLAEFPATPVAQQTLASLAAAAAEQGDSSGRKTLWRLADIARTTGLVLPDEYRALACAEKAATPAVPVDRKQQPRLREFADEDGASRLVLERKGERDQAPQLLFLGERIRKRLDNKFVVTALDLNTGDEVWKTEELRLKGKGQETGFLEAFVHQDLVLVHGLYDLLALNLSDGTVRWRYRTPFDFEIRSALLTGDLLILSGAAETLALFVDTQDPTGEVVWRASELGDPYTEPYVHGERLVSVRKFPFVVTVRRRGTGQLQGRLSLPDLSLFEQHPLLEDGPAELPIARHGKHLVVTDGWYYILLDIERLAVVWKRLIDNNNVNSEPALRFALSDENLAVAKEDYDLKAIYLLSVATGEVLWKTDPKDSKSPRPLYSMLLAGDRLYGLEPHAGQGYYLVGRDAPTGELLFRQEVDGYQAKPEATLLPRPYGDQLVVRTADRQNFQLQAFQSSDGAPTVQIDSKGVGPYGVPGRMSYTVQNGRLVLMNKDQLSQ